MLSFYEELLRRILAGGCSRCNEEEIDGEAVD